MKRKPRDPLKPVSRCPRKDNTEAYSNFYIELYKKYGKEYYKHKTKVTI